MSDFFKSHLRTYVPVWVAALAAILGGKGLDLDVDATTTVVTGLAISGYYTLARLLEKVPSLAWLGKFLLSVGFVAGPAYGAAAGSSSESGGSAESPAAEREPYTGYEYLREDRRG
ncbi:hypothetical protein [Nonomuraea basaltis]|uniref:hypothetical protein n=1 Tax=Nonomuraea basaltis TaxID=2495887 RepID=UPI00110C6DF5|nr:hypothetical protein [Nonomuraea basaltis]TMR93282.1 hypothetical protein EJK15_39965 [Nonomuraea basaltis]